MRTKRIRGLNILITAGPTIEYFDSVRFISNASSGKMGYAIADAAIRAGHHATLVSGPLDRPAPRGVKVVRVTSALEMLQASRKVFVTADAAIFSAAVCDYRPRRRSKLKKAKSTSGIRIELISNPDIAAMLGARKKSRITIGFALEDHSGHRNALRKLQSKHLDAIVLNKPSNIGADLASAECFAPGSGWTRWRQCSKQQMAGKIVELLEALALERGTLPDRHS